MKKKIKKITDDSNQAELNPIPKTKKFQKLAQSVVLTMAESLVMDGHIDIDGKSGGEIFQAVREVLQQEVLNKTNPIFVSIDYTKDLLKTAREYEEDKSYHLACLFYSLWFEHWVNRLIVSGGKRRGITERELVTIIRDTDINRGKTSWLLTLLDIPKINKKHFQKISKIIELRNAFVHYKWKSEDIDKDASEENRKALEDIQKTIQYLKRFERKFFFGENKMLLRKALRI